MMMQRSTISAVCALGLLAAPGCGAERTIPLGKDNPPGVVGASLVDYEGAWAGYVEAHAWDDASDLVRLRVDANGDGVIEVGDPSAPAPAVIPEDFDGTLKASQYTLLAGFSYAFEAATVTDRRIRIGTSSHQLYADWCAGFAPVADTTNPGSYNCAPNLGHMWNADDPAGCRLLDADMTPYPCEKLVCIHVCSCSETSCSVADTGTDVQIDAALTMEGEELTGTLLLGGQRMNIRMVRAE